MSEEAEMGWGKMTALMWKGKKSGGGEPCDGAVSPIDLLVLASLLHFKRGMHILGRWLSVWFSIPKIGLFADRTTSS